jgi:hypothetical protein
MSKGLTGGDHLAAGVVDADAADGQVAANVARCGVNGTGPGRTGCGGMDAYGNTFEAGGRAGGEPYSDRM